MGQLPTRIDPSSMAAERRVLEGELALTQMARLRAMVEQPHDAVKLRLEGSIDEAGRSLLKGRVNALVSMQCQRCMGAVSVRIATDFILAVVTSEQAAALLPDEYEPLLLQGDDAVLAELIEDELLLNMPIVARHDMNACVTDAKDPTKVVNDVYKPFAGLADLLAKRTD